MAVAELPIKLLDKKCSITESLFAKADDRLVFETYFNNTCKGRRTCAIPLKPSEGSPGIFDGELTGINDGSIIPRLTSRC